MNLLDIQDMFRLLRGGFYVPSGDTRMNACPEVLPVEPVRVLTEYVYPHPECKDTFQRAMQMLAEGSAGDVYLCFQYFRICLLIEDEWKKATFCIDRQRFILILKKQIRRHENELRGTVTFHNGDKNENPMEYIELADKRFQKRYGFSVL